MTPRGRKCADAPPTLPPPPPPPPPLLPPALYELPSELLPPVPLPLLPEPRDNCGQFYFGRVSKGLKTHVFKKRGTNAPQKAACPSQLRVASSRQRFEPQCRHFLLLAESAPSRTCLREMAHRNTRNRERLGGEGSGGSPSRKAKRT